MLEHSFVGYEEQHRIGISKSQAAGVRLSERAAGSQPRITLTGLQSEEES